MLNANQQRTKAQKAVAAYGGSIINPMERIRAFDILVGARALVADARNWTQKASARDTFDNVVPCGDPRARKWDLYGAIHAAAGAANTMVRTIDLPNGIDDALRYVAAALRDRYGDLTKNHTILTTVWNDWTHRTHADVIETLDEAIRMATSIDLFG